VHGGERHYDDVGELLDDDRDLSGGTDGQVAGITGHIDDDRIGGDARTLAADHPHRRHRAEDLAGRPVRHDNRLITGAQLADLGVVDVGVDNVSSCADYHDLGVGR
jgi:hypothetical protein